MHGMSLRRNTLQQTRNQCCVRFLGMQTGKILIFAFMKNAYECKSSHHKCELITVLQSCERLISYTSNHNIPFHSITKAGTVSNMTSWTINNLHGKRCRTWIASAPNADCVANTLKWIADCCFQEHQGLEHLWTAPVLDNSIHTSPVMLKSGLKRPKSWTKKKKNKWENDCSYREGSDATQGEILQRLSNEHRTNTNRIKR